MFAVPLPRASASGWPELPKVPTMQEVGYENLVFPLDTVLLAPAKTLPENVQMA